MWVFDCIAPKLPKSQKENDSDIEGSAIKGAKRENELQDNLIDNEYHFSVRICARG